jgi:polyhydroxybutyrate depolymerase
MMKSRITVLTVFAAVLVLGVMWLRGTVVDADEMPRLHTKRLEIQTSQGRRECVIHIPETCDRARPAPLVIMLHGFGGTALNAARESGWSDKADREGFIIVYPEATRPDRALPAHFRRNPQAWNDGSGRFHAAAERVDDVAFIGAMIDRIGEICRIDAGGIFVTGFSNGASMTFRVGAELSQRITAIAPVSGTCWMERLESGKAVPLCYITGAADSLNPLDGGYPKLAFGGKDQGGAEKPAVQTFIDRWSSALGCAAIPVLDETVSGVRRRQYGSDRQRAEVVFLAVEGLGHHWPGGERQVAEFLVGRYNRKLKATDAIWDFFSVQRKR